MTAANSQLQVQEALDGFVRDAQAVGVQLSERSGAPVAMSGDLFRVDPGRFAASLAGLQANAQALMRPLGPESVARMHLDAGSLELVLAQVKTGFSIAVVFDDRTSLGVVQWRLRTLVARLAELLRSGGAESAPGRITDEEIENLFA